MISHALPTVPAADDPLACLRAALARVPADAAAALAAVKAGARPWGAGEEFLVTKAVSLHMVAVVDAMLARGCPVDTANQLGQPLVNICLRSSAPAEMLDTLLAYKPDLSIIDQGQMTALGVACNFADLPAVEKLVAAGADPAQPIFYNGGFCPPIVIAAVKNRADIFACLQKQGSPLRGNIAGHFWNAVRSAENVNAGDVLAHLGKSGYVTLPYGVTLRKAGGGPRS